MRVQDSLSVQNHLLERCADFNLILRKHMTLTTSIL